MGEQSLIPLAPALSLKFAEIAAGSPPYATSRLQRGLLLMHGDVLLAEEAVGFGVPVLKRGLQAVFPSAAQVEVQREGKRTLVRADFRLNLVERLTRRREGIVGGKWFYRAKDVLAATIRWLPPTRGPLTAASSWLRRVFGWETSYVPAGFAAQVAITFRVESPSGSIRIEIECAGVPNDVTEVVLMHEQGAHIFDRYEDSSGLTLKDDQIGCWDEVRGGEAWFASSSRRLAFRVGAVPGARLFRGRELIGTRLAWAGFGYSFPPSLGGIEHELTVSRLA